MPAYIIFHLKLGSLFTTKIKRHQLGLTVVNCITISYLNMNVMCMSYLYWHIIQNEEMSMYFLFKIRVYYIWTNIGYEISRTSKIS